MGECKKWVFTFGTDSPMTGYVISIQGDYNEARKKMFDAYGSQWCGQYSAEEWEEFKATKEWARKKKVIEL